MKDFKLIRIINIFFLAIMTYISLIQPSLTLFAWIYFPSLAVYETVTIWSFIQESRERKNY